MESQNPYTKFLLEDIRNAHNQDLRKTVHQLTFEGRMEAVENYAEGRLRMRGEISAY